ncbi:choline dehydrogenase-like flavoprotein [Bradyrhizobium sp. LA8.1]
MMTPNPIPIIHKREYQEKWQWPDLLTRRVAGQEPRFYWRGKGLGGSSMMNGQIAIRGVADAFDEWAANGCTGWSAKDVMPLFSVIEDDLEFGDAPGHGSGGPLPVYRAPPEKWGPIDRGLRDAALATAIPGAPTSTVLMARASPAIPSTAATAAASRPTRAISSRRAAAPISRFAGTRWSIAC